MRSAEKNLKEKSSKETLNWIDPLKAIGIITVVAGHVYGGKTQDFIFVFHMPLFFFLGGFLLRTRDNYFEYFKSKAIYLIVPYISFLCLIYPIQTSQILLGDDGVAVMDWVRIIARPILGGHLFFGLTSAFWFATCFLITQQLGNYLTSKLSGLLLLGVSYMNYLFFPWLRLPLSLNIVCGTTPFFLLGFWFRKIHLRGCLKSRS